MYATPSVVKRFDLDDTRFDPANPEVVGTYDVSAEMVEVLNARVSIAVTQHGDVYSMKGTECSIEAVYPNSRAVARISADRMALSHESIVSALQVEPFVSVYNASFAGKHITAMKRHSVEELSISLHSPETGRLEVALLDQRQRPKISTSWQCDALDEEERLNSKAIRYPIDLIQSMEKCVIAANENGVKTFDIRKSGNSALLSTSHLRGCRFICPKNITQFVIGTVEGSKSSIFTFQNASQLSQDYIESVLSPNPYKRRRSDYHEQVLPIHGAIHNNTLVVMCEWQQRDGHVVEG
jgi:hypothetical protein